jgi:hypothetical protein
MRISVGATTHGQFLLLDRRTVSAMDDLPAVYANAVAAVL